MSNKNGCLITVTKFEENSDNVALPLVMANAALSSGEDVLLWLTLDGVKLAKTGSVDGLKARSFSPADELLKNYLDSGGRIGICPPCAKTHGITEENMVGGEWMGAVALLEQSQGWRTLSF